MMGVYEIVNLANGRSYVGSTNNMKKRWFNHINCLRRDAHSNPHLQAAFNKYGEGAFVFCVLEQIGDESILCDREQVYLDRLFEVDDNPYNIAICAEASARGIPKSKETRRKLSKANMGKSPSWEARRKQSMKLRGRKFTDEHKRKIGIANKGRVKSLEERRKISEGNKGKVISEETRRKMSMASTGRVKSAGERRKLSEANKGKKLSEETKQKISKVRAKPYPAFIHRDTKEIIPAGKNLKRMCVERGLRTRSMNQVKNGLQEHSDGWILLDGGGER